MALSLAAAPPMASAASLDAHRERPGRIVGGWLFSNTWGPGQGGVDAFYAGITCLGAVVASILVGGLVKTFMQGRGQVAE